MVARLGFKRRATAVRKSNLIRSIKFRTAVARRLKQALAALTKKIPKLRVRQFQTNRIFRSNRFGTNFIGDVK